jgi:hypothetical protein
MKFKKYARFLFFCPTTLVLIALSPAGSPTRNGLVCRKFPTGSSSFPPFSIFRFFPRNQSSYLPCHSLHSRFTLWWSPTINRANVYVGFQVQLDLTGIFSKPLSLSLLSFPLCMLVVLAIAIIAIAPTPSLPATHRECPTHLFLFSQCTVRSRRSRSPSFRSSALICGRRSTNRWSWICVRSSIRSWRRCKSRLFRRRRFVRFLPSFLSSPHPSPISLHILTPHTRHRPS